MSAEVVFFNTEEAAKILGVNISTIKRWTDSGKLDCVKTPGGHRKFEMQHLARFLDHNKKLKAGVNHFAVEREEDLHLSVWVMKHNYEALREYIRSQALLCNRHRVADVLKSLILAQYALHDIYDHLITGVLHEVGELWEKGIISVTEEHFASQTIRDCLIRLQGMIKPGGRRRGLVMCMNLHRDLHDTALKMVDHVLESNGFKVLYSGQQTPQMNIRKIFESYGPKRLYISSTYVDDKKESQAEFDALCDAAHDYSVDVYVGGSGFDLLDYKHKAVVERLHSFYDVYQSCETEQ